MEIFIYVLSNICTPLAKVTIEAGDYTRINTPIEVAMDGVLIGFAGDFHRLNIGEGIGENRDN